ncbi:unnamed protein product [Polarella glacialis]|uniref:Uncharacterized protein n=1 Tax=Polarella glacialis TaxID=89957 RepID=A0A813JBX7_POLGL|nr:unnamed protein product [Polarella glacialis]
MLLLVIHLPGHASLFEKGISCGWDPVPSILAQVPIKGSNAMASWKKRQQRKQQQEAEQVVEAEPVEAMEVEEEVEAETAEEAAAVAQQTVEAEPVEAMEAEEEVEAATAEEAAPVAQQAVEAEPVEAMEVEEEVEAETAEEAAPVAQQAVEAEPVEAMEAEEEVEAMEAEEAAPVAQQVVEAEPVEAMEAEEEVKAETAEEAAPVAQQVVEAEPVVEAMEAEEEVEAETAEEAAPVAQQVVEAEPVVEAMEAEEEVEAETAEEAAPVAQQVVEVEPVVEAMEAEEEVEAETAEEAAPVAQQVVEAEPVVEAMEAAPAEQVEEAASRNAAQAPPSTPRWEPRERTRTPRRDSEQGFVAYGLPHANAVTSLATRVRGAPAWYCSDAECPGEALVIEWLGYTDSILGPSAERPDALSIRLSCVAPTGRLLMRIRDILREEGPRGFYRGLVPNVQRAALVNLGELATYDQAKGMILESSSLQDGVAVHTLSALCSGFVASVCATPADVVKSRIMAGQASSIVDCVRDTVRNEGIAAMWKGFLPNWARLGPWQLTFWVSYEYLRKTSGYGSF